MLRLYERRGIISPDIDPTNGYRYYDDWQVNLLWECKRYQSMGFSLSEIKEMISTDNLATLTMRIKQGEQSLEERIEREKLVLKGYECLLAQLNRIPTCLNMLEEQDVEELAFVAEREEHDLLVEAAGHPEIEFMNERHGLCRPFFVFPGDEERYYWGFAMDAETYTSLGGPISSGALGHTRAGHALITWVDAGKRGNFGRHLFDALFDEARKRNLQPAGDLYGFLLARCTEQDGYHRYVKAVLPVK